MSGTIFLMVKEFVAVMFQLVCYRYRTNAINGVIKSISGEADFFSMPLERADVTCTVSIVPQYSTMDISITWSENKWDVSLAFPVRSGGWISCICDASGGESFQSRY